MKQYDKEVLQAALKDEEKVIKDLTDNYIKALAEVKTRIKVLMANAEETQLQSKIYQLQYQQLLERQLEECLKVLQNGNIKTVTEYLNKCYENGFVGNMYSLNQQNVPLVFPINQNQVIQAVMKPTDSFTFSQRLYDNVAELKTVVKSELSRGIASNLTYSQIARTVSDYVQIDMNKSFRIARTEGHRIQNTARLDSMNAAKDAGADIVKQWDATLDGATRPEHAELDGQIVELDEDFTVGSYSAPCPGMFGDPYMDCNCRCAMLQRARWAVKWEEGSTRYIGRFDNMTDEQLLPTAMKLHISVDELRQTTPGDDIIPIRAKNYDDFKSQYDKLWHYHGSELEKEVEARMASYKKGKG